MTENRELAQAFETDAPKRRSRLWAKLLVAALVLVTLVAPEIVSEFARTVRRGEPPEFDRHKAERDIRSLVGALEEYAADHGGSYPRDLGALLLPNGEGHSYLDLERAPLDPWGHEYFYEPPEGSRSFRVGSFGEDGELGGERFDRDLDNWKLEAVNWIEDDRDLAK